jgi:DNA-binding NtrC family response regulator
MNRGITVLLVDDDEMVSDCISTWLEDEGFEVYTADNAEQTLSLMASISVDVALVDLQLEETNGEDLIAQASADHPGTRFMVHTGNHRYQLPERLLEAGVQQCNVLFKPIFDLDALSASIRQLVKGVAPL